MKGKTKKIKVNTTKEQIALQLKDAHTNVLKTVRKRQKKERKENRKKEGKINIKKGR